MKVSMDLSPIADTHAHTHTLLDELCDVLLFHFLTTHLTHLCLCCRAVMATKKGSKRDAPLMSQIKHHSSPCISLTLYLSYTLPHALQSWHSLLLCTQQKGFFSACPLGPVVHILFLPCSVFTGPNTIICIMII